MSTLNAHYRLESLMILECVHVCVSHLGLSFPTMQSVEMMNSALRGGPWVGENLEDVKIVAQSVCSHQQHSYNKHTHTQSSALGIHPTILPITPNTFFFVRFI